MSTLPQLLIERAKAMPNVVAWRQFRLGVWNENTWASAHAEAAAIGSGLAALGMQKGDVVAVLAGNSVTAISSEIGAQGIGCVVAVLSSELAPSTVRSVLSLIHAKAVIVGDQEQFDKVQDANVASVQSTVVLDARGFRHIEVAGRPDAERVLTIEQLKNRSGNASDWDARVERLLGSEPSTILCFVNRKSSEVEAHRFSHDEVIRSAETLRNEAEATSADTVAVQTSLADPIEHTLSVVGPLVIGLGVNIGQTGLATQSMRQVQPSLVALNGAWLNGIAVDVERRVSGGRGLKGFAARKALSSPPNLLTTPLKIAKLSRTRLVGLGALLLSFVFLLFSVSLNDFVRLLVVAAIALAAALITVVTGWSVTSSARRGLGLSRTRAILNGGALDTETTPAVASLLGSLSVPVVAVSAAAGEVLGHVRSEVLA